jgi:hypothetical protein
VQTLSFLPYRVDLTPFAATLRNGQPHTIGLSVYNADDYFAVTATLLVYEDRGSTIVTGATTTNTLGSGPNPVVNENITIDSNDIPIGTIVVTSDRTFTISGYINTSHGKVTTTLNQTVNFSNLQNYTDSANLYAQTTFVDSAWVQHRMATKMKPLPCSNPTILPPRDQATFRPRLRNPSLAPTRKI